tara:strand:+ start:110 stop:1849 length:1740 start_codon:yes stop_codon:yes gene_type:complete
MANKSVGFLTVAFGADLRGFDRAMKKAQRNIKKFGTNMQSIGSNLTRNITLPVLAIGGASIKMASDLEETRSKFKTVFSSIEGDALQTAETFKKSFGLSSQAAMGLLADTGDLLVGFGFTEKEALNLSKQVNELAVDLASFTNFSGGAEGASQALTKALLGEREAIKSLGIAITETDLKRFAEEQGLVLKELNKVEKAQLTFQLATRQSQKAIGDYARTSGSFANQFRELQERTKDLSADFGTMLLPVAKKLLDNTIKLVEKFQSLSLAEKTAAIESVALASAIGPALNILGRLILIGPKILAFFFSFGGLIAVLAGGFVLLKNNITRVINLLANKFASEELASILTAMGAFGEQFGIFGAKQLKDLGIAMATIVATDKQLPVDEFKGFGAILKELGQDILDFSKIAELLNLGEGGSGITTGGKLHIFPMNKGRMKDILFPNLSKDIKEATTKLFDFNTEMKNFQNGFQTAMERAFQSQDRFFKAFIENLKLTVRQQFFSALSKGITSKIFSLAIPALTGLLTGGTSTLIGPTLQGAGVNIPFLSKMGGPQTVQVEGVIRGTDIFLSNARTSGNRLRSV